VFNFLFLGQIKSLKGSVFVQQSRISPFLTFNGNAAEALEFYAASFPGAKVLEKQFYTGTEHHYTEDDAGRVLIGILEVFGETIFFMDMASKYPAPEISWSNSILVSCNSEEEFYEIFNPLSAGGNVMMGPEPVTNIRLCAWVSDKFGVTWQPVWR
jgi:predicted 3-demethylubiquinone-9 3-methyltransferase (glyoxalase superfamily)